MPATAAPTTVTVPAQAAPRASRPAQHTSRPERPRPAARESLAGFLLVNAVLPGLLLLALATLPVVITLALQGEL